MIVHAVGPMWSTGKAGEEDKLSSAVYNILKSVENYGFKSVAIPAISSGIFGFPKRLCAKVLFDVVEFFARERKDDSTKREYLKEVRFTNFDKETVDIFSEEFYYRYIKPQPTYNPRKFYL